MAQIAERAGAALSTVSYVLSGKRPVSEDMRRRVLAAIEELNYRPHGPARALASGASHTIALFLPSANWDLVPVQQTFVAGATQATSARGYGLLLSTAPTDPGTIVELIRDHRADGVILMETLADDPRVDQLRASGLPFSLIGRTADTLGAQLRRPGLRRRGAGRPELSGRARAPLHRALQLPRGAARGRLHIGAHRPGRVREGRAPRPASAASI